MRRLLVIIPFVVEEELREAHLAALRSAACHDTHLEVIALESGPSPADFDRPDFEHAVSAIVDLVELHQVNFDGIFISCFEDPALAECRKIANVPIVAPCETSMLMMRLTAERFFVISPDKRSEDTLRGVAAACGVGEQFGSFEWVGFPVGNPSVDVSDLVERTASAIQSARDRKVGEVAILGCTDFLERYPAIQALAGGRVIEPASQSIHLLEWLTGAKG